MAARARRARESVRRLVAGVVLTLAAGVGLGDDLLGRPDARRGSRELQLDLPHLGTTTVHVPRTTPGGVVLFLHRNGTPAERRAITAAVPWHAMLVDVDVSRLQESETSPDARAAVVEDISRRAQRDAGLTRYLRPVLLATPGALPVASDAVVGASPVALPAAVVVGTEAPTGTSVAERWRHASSALAVASPLDEALRVAAREPARDATPVQRWLEHFDLPMTAAWSSHPRAMLVLLSPARGWRAHDDAMAQRLAEEGVHVVGIDALRAFWQRRSPRDVALELQRLTDALASTGLPVYIGGREFGAETMAVAGEMMASRKAVAGVVLVDPGPRAFFEVEPPALALRPLGPHEWSTREALHRLDLRTLCVTHAPDSPSTFLCGSLARERRAMTATTANDPTRLADVIRTFIDRAPSGN